MDMPHSWFAMERTLLVASSRSCWNPDEQSSRQEAINQSARFQRAVTLDVGFLWVLNTDTGSEWLRENADAIIILYVCWVLEGYSALSRNEMV